MDQSEKQVEAYLKHIGFKSIVYEPDGNIPPDFLVDNNIAVEVRRLNQNFDDGVGVGPRGLEEVSIPLWRSFRKYLINLGPAPNSGNSWFVSCRFRRPVPKWKVIKNELDKCLKPFMRMTSPQPFEAKLVEQFFIDVIPANSQLPTFFRPAGYIDQESGGWLLSEMGTNLTHCIAEKSAKITKYKTRYSEWWLVLPDHIGYGLDEFDQGLFRDQIQVSYGEFSKVILLDPRNPTRAFEI